MFAFVGIVVSDLKRSAELYGAMLSPLGFRVVAEHRVGEKEGWVEICGSPPQFPVFVIAAGPQKVWWTSQWVTGVMAHNPVHLRFAAPSKEAVHRFHAAGLALGAKHDRPPGSRQHGRYCASLFDPDSNTVEVGYFDIGSDD